jgi:SAM-dependent methyltransferase
MRCLSLFPPALLSLMIAGAYWRTHLTLRHENHLQRFDRAYCHQGLQFFADPEEACRRVRLALKPGGQFTVAVWAHVERQPLFLVGCNVHVSSH